jgi:hypothetical protein
MVYDFQPAFYSYVAQKLLEADRDIDLDGALGVCREGSRVVGLKQKRGGVDVEDTSALFKSIALQYDYCELNGVFRQLMSVRFMTLVSLMDASSPIRAEVLVVLHKFRELLSEIDKLYYKDDAESMALAATLLKDDMYILLQTCRGAVQMANSTYTAPAGG